MANKMFQRLIFCISFLICGFSVLAQQRSYDTTTIKIFDEIETIQSVYILSNHIAFTATYYMEDVDSVTVRDTSVAQYKISGEKFRMQIDSITSIQNEHYFGTMYYDNKAIVIQKPVPLPKQVMGINVKDSIFQQMAMAGMTAADSGDYRKINVLFDSSAIFTKYEIVYNTGNYRIANISYSMRKERELSSTKRVNMTIKFTGYSTGSFDDTVFSTDDYFKVNSSTEIILSTGISDFEIINMLNDN